MNLLSFAQEGIPSLIESASNAYEEGSPILTDQEFDLLEETGLKLDTRNFRTKVQHPFAMGSLSKIKTAEDFQKWLPKEHQISATPKLDGASLRLSYINGFLVQASTRGDGRIGSDITANVLQTNVVKQLNQQVTVEIRCEAIISQVHADKFDKNLRNVAAGMLGAKDIRPELALIDCIAIDVIEDRPMSWLDKKERLSSLFPAERRVPITTYVPSDQSPCPFEWAQNLKFRWEELLRYALDGIVIQRYELETAILLNTTDLLPKDKVALKFGSLEAPSSILHIEWSLGQHGKLTPVLNIEPTELDGTTVSRVSASNYALLKQGGMGVGAQVMVTKSGDIIPFLTKITKESQVGLELPPCPACGTIASLSQTGVDALCINDDCEGKVSVKLKKTIGLFGIDFIADATLDALGNAGFDSMEKLFAATVAEIENLPGFGKKSAEYLVTSLKSARLTEAQVIKSAFLKGIGERKGKALLDHYGSLADVISSVMIGGLADVEGFGPIQAQLINENIGVIAEQLQRFQSLGVVIAPHETQQTSATQQVVCCTGTCNQYPRKELAQVLEERGYRMVDSVTKDTTLLLCADPNGSSSKLKKAHKQGIPIQSYDEFFAN